MPAANDPEANLNFSNPLRRQLRPWAVLAVLPLLAHCVSAPSLEGVEPSYALPPSTTPGKLDRGLLSTLDMDPTGDSVQLIQQNAMAFAYRATTATNAERTLDVQYYIWHDDMTGRLLATELLIAAERGVRVRVLVDDMDARAKNDTFAVVDMHPNVEVRIFNPFYSRYGILGKLGEGLTSGARLNQRMHNKAWIADNRVAIIGGRNIGDEYFGAAEHSNFSDLDLVMSGPIVAAVSRSFDEYWNSEHAIPVSRLESKPPAPQALANMLAAAREYKSDAKDDPYVQKLRNRETRAEMLADAPKPVNVPPAELLVDDPSKIGSKDVGIEASNVLAGLLAVETRATSEILIISPYFVPGKTGAQGLAEREAGGVRIAVLTNSLAATDVAAVHTGYARYRKQLLLGGVELYEMKRKAGNESGRNRISVTGSSGASLHTKAMVIDERWVFVGSMNLDPRSANLNTEMGVLIESPVLARQLRQQFNDNIAPELSYRVVYEPDEGLVWYDRAGGKDRRLEKEPDASLGRRITTNVLRILPIEGQL